MDICSGFLQKFVLSGPLRYIRVLSISLNSFRCHGDSSFEKKV